MLSLEILNREEIGSKSQIISHNWIAVSRRRKPPAHPPLSTINSQLSTNTVRSYRWLTVRLYEGVSKQQNQCNN